MKSISASTIQITSFQMFICQSGQGRRNIHRERSVPEDVESQPAESCQIEKRQLGHVFDNGKMTEELAVFTDSDWAGCKETQKVIKYRRSDAGRTHLESTHTKTEGYRKRAVQKQNCMQQHWERRKQRSPKYDARLGLCDEASVEH